ncbi:MAG: helix-turn-helix domain-containing protein [Pseudolabrys sp.]|jgi:predicted transcriptional regulator
MLNKKLLSKEQCRAARGWLGLTQDELSSVTGVAQKTIARFETGVVVPHDRTLMDLQRALEEMGIEFVFEGSVGVGIRASRAAAATAKGQAKKRAR